MINQQFGHTESGEEVQAVTIEGGGLTATFLTYGAILQDLRLQGQKHPLVLGFPVFAPYLTHSPYFGATAGRCINRIRDGHLVIDGREYQLDTNFLGKHTLHGGSQGIGKSLWQIVDRSDNQLVMTITQADGHMGFPGKLEISARFTLLADAVLDIQMEAMTDAPTICNLAHHSYFNLDGSDTISQHRLRIEAEHYLPTDDELIPTGEIKPVAGTRFDFRSAGTLSQAHPIDTNFCLSSERTATRPVAWLTSELSGISLECRTTEPGLQIYDASQINIELPGLHGKPMPAYAGLAIEPQIWPDANHHSHFPQALLRPVETYSQHTQFVFGGC